MLGLSLSWVARTKNRKTGDIPTAYVGKTVSECRSSCEGCALLDGPCYAWNGLARVSMTRIERIQRDRPERYTIERALRYRNASARMARLGAMGDPARADPLEVERARRLILATGLGLLGYTHFWREEWAQHLKGICLASCEWIEDAEHALNKGWTPALILPWDYALDGAKTFPLPSGGVGRICPAQLNDKVTCNDCRICWTDHPIWKNGRVRAIGFLDHSRKANAEKRRWQKGRQLPMFDRRPDIRPGARERYDPNMGEPIYTCEKCGKVADALYGDDLKFHCSSMDCDLVVRILDPEELQAPKQDKRAFTQNVFPKKPKAAKSTKASSSSGRTGREILARMDARNRARKNGRVVPNKARPKKAKQPKAKEEHEVNARHGTCEGCGVKGWMLAKNPRVLCAGCFRTGTPKKAAPKKAKTTKKRKTPQPTRTKRAPKRTDGDISREVSAIESVAHAIDDLNPQEIQRVFGYVTMRYAQTHGLQVRHVEGQALPVSLMLEG